MSNQNKRKILLLPGLDGTGEFLKPLQNLLSASDNVFTKVDIVSYPEKQFELEDICRYIDENYNLEDYSDFFAESFGTQILPRLISKYRISNSRLILLAPVYDVPKRFKGALHLPEFIFNMTFNKLLSSPIFRKFTLGSIVNTEISEFLKDKIQKLSPKVLVNRLKGIRPLKSVDLNQKKVLIIKTKYDLLIPTSLQNKYKTQLNIVDSITIKAPHFAALTNTQEVADIIIQYE